MNGVPVTLEIAAVTDIGQKRASNQDNFYVNGCYIDHYNIAAERFETVDSMDTHVLAVCDGMGGHADGDVAAMIGVSTISDYAATLSAGGSLEETERNAEEMLQAANDRILEQSRVTGKKMGSTVSMLVVATDYVYACNLGDSEIYHKHQYGIDRLSKPQTFAQALLDVGAITENQASHSYIRNQLSQYLGMENRRGIRPNRQYTSIHNGDMLLICSDGITDVLQRHAIYASLSSERPVKDIADALIEKALRKGSGDNLTVVIARVLDDGRALRLRRRLTMLGVVAAGVIALLFLLGRLLG